MTGVSTFMNSTANNIVWPRDWRDNTHAPGTVFIDNNPAAAADAKWKMVAQWNVGGVHPTSMDDAGVYSTCLALFGTLLVMDWSSLRDCLRLQ